VTPTTIRIEQIFVLSLQIENVHFGFSRFLGTSTFQALT